MSLNNIQLENIPEILICKTHKGVAIKHLYSKSDLKGKPWCDICNCQKMLKI